MLLEGTNKETYSILTEMHRSFMIASGKQRYLNHCPQAAADAVAFFRHVECVLKIFAERCKGPHETLLVVLDFMTPKILTRLYLVMNHADNSNEVGASQPSVAT